MHGTAAAARYIRVAVACSTRTAFWFRVSCGRAADGFYRRGGSVYICIGAAAAAAERLGGGGIIPGEFEIPRARVDESAARGVR